MKKILCTLTFMLVLTCMLTSCYLPFLPGVETTVTTPKVTTPEIPEETTSPNRGNADISLANERMFCIQFL